MTEPQASPLGFLGAGGQAIQLADYLEDEVAFFAVGQEFLAEGDGTISLEDPPDWARETAVVVAVGPPGLKRAMVAAWPGRRYGRVIGPNAYVGPTATLGEGAMIAVSAIVSARVEIGRHVLVSSGSIVGHECVIGDYTTISPGAKIGGGSTVGAGVYIGIGATVRNGITIGEGAVIGAGAVVLHDVAALATVVGVPARQIREADDWLWRI